MVEKIQVATPADVAEISTSHVIDAPPDLVFDAFSSPSQLASWWGPTGFSLTTHRMRFAPDGEWLFTMHGPDGRNYENKIVFSEIERPNRISHHHVGDYEVEPPNMTTTVSFAHEKNMTRLVWRAIFTTIAERDRVDREYGAAQGLAETLSRLLAHVGAAKDRAFTISRRFNAPQSFLWAALTDPARMANWWGPKGFPVIAARMDFRPGGQYLYGLETPGGGSMWGRFVYREIEEPSQITLVSSFSDENGGVTRHPLSKTWPLETLSIFQLESEGEQTKVTVRGLPIGATDEEHATFAGAFGALTQGWNGTFEQLANYIADEKVA